MEGVGTAWSIEIQDAPAPFQGVAVSDGDEPAAETSNEQEEHEDGTSAVVIYEQTIQNPKQGAALGQGGQADTKTMEIETTDLQNFLSEQLETLDRLNTEDDQRDRQLRKGGLLKETENAVPTDDTSRVNEQIGPVQFNMGGIQVDADDMLRKLKVGNKRPLCTRLLFYCFGRTFR